MSSLIALFSFIIIISCSCSSIFAQQPYVREDTTECNEKHNSSSSLGYFCNGVNRSCQTFITFRAVPPYTTLAAISKLLAADPSQISALNSNKTTFGTNKLVIVPVTCSCHGGYYQSNTSYIIKPQDTYLAIANNTFQGITTCQALENQKGNPNRFELETNENITVPLRCACPTKSQVDLGVKYLMSYLVDYDDDDSTISEDFGVDNELLLKANQLTDIDNTIYPFTTLLVPLQSPPTNSSTIVRPPPPPPPPPRTSTPTIFSSNTSSNRNWLYALYGAVGGGSFVLLLGALIYCLVFCRRKKKADPTLVPANSTRLDQEKTVKISLEFLESLSDIAQSIKVYSIEELQRATNDFSINSLIEGSVYRGEIDGNPKAIKKMEGDVSKEINLLQKINHSCLIRLSGVCFNEGHWYLVYEFATNGALSDWIYNEKNNGKCLSWSQRIQIALDVATGLNYLHCFTTPSHVHKDIKCSNILLDSDFRAKIANFCLVRSTNAQQENEFSLTNHIVGTIGYLAPEYLENGLVSTKLDVYAFGVLLLEMLAGTEVSFLYKENRDLSHVYSGVLNNERKESLKQFMDPSMQEKYPSELVGFVVQIIDLCIKKNPEIRPPIEEVVKLLSKALSSSLTWESSIK
ncbi:lysM domain receptor-like kinase 4 [Humulus lupulus]|uniref:lysM domain receptor-like kinase 4 n=1 Tax=Humulus lupulus TaxID=3486 RepID=UPI002B40B427|nr:lysM domain receptor-like kinase 4 [Humulus lupulus]